MIRYSTQSDSPRSVRWPIGNYCQLEIKKIFLFASRTIGNKIDISCRISASGTQKALPTLESFKENRSETRTHFFVRKKAFVTIHNNYNSAELYWKNRFRSKSSVFVFPRIF